MKPNGTVVAIIIINFRVLQQVKASIKRASSNARRSLYAMR